MEKINAYLRRIGFSSTPNVDFKTLHNLQRLHLQAVPYETLDIIRNVPLSLDVDDLYKKVVERNRGGYCFELNGLFIWLLRNLGFEASEYSSRFLGDDPAVPIRCHRIIVVSLEGQDYFCDVGVGRIIPREPIPIIIGAESKQNGEVYKFEEDDFFGFILCEWKHDTWRRICSFTKEPQLDADFLMPSFYCEMHPNSNFRTVDKVHIFTENGRKSVVDREIRIFSPEGVEVINPQTEAEYEELLQLHFGIKL